MRDTAKCGGHAHVLCQSGSGPLADGKPHDAFDLYRIHEHQGDRAKAVKAAAKALGMDAESRRAHRVPELARMSWTDYLAIRVSEAGALHMHPGALDVAVKQEHDAQREQCIAELACMPWHDFLGVRVAEAERLHMAPGALQVAVRRQREAQQRQAHQPIHADSTCGCAAQPSKA
jgi:hypothetical protein